MVENPETKLKISIPYLAGILVADAKEEKDQFAQEAFLLINNNNFNQRIEWLRKQRAINYKYFNKLRRGLKRKLDLRQGISKKKTRITNDKKYQALRDYVFNRITMEEINKIRRRFVLSDAWKYSLLKYIFTNRMPKPNFLPKVKLEDSAYKYDRKLFIEVYGNNNWKDIKRIWKSKVEPSLKYLPDYNIKGIREKMTLEKGKYLQTLFESGLKGKILANKAKKKYPRLEFEPELIRKYRERYKKNRDRINR